MYFTPTLARTSCVTGISPAHWSGTRCGIRPHPFTAAVMRVRQSRGRESLPMRFPRNVCPLIPVRRLWRGLLRIRASQVAALRHLALVARDSLRAQSVQCLVGPAHPRRSDRVVPRVRPGSDRVRPRALPVTARIRLPAVTTILARVLGTVMAQRGRFEASDRCRAVHTGAPRAQRTRRQAEAIHPRGLLA